MTIKLTQTQAHRDSSTAVLRGQQRKVQVRKAPKPVSARWHQDAAGTWFVTIASGSTPLLATDLEVTLHLEVLDLRRQLDEARSRFRVLEY